ASAGDVAGLGEQALLGGRERVRLAAEQVLDVEGPGREALVAGDEALQLVAEREQLGGEPGDGGAEGGAQPFGRQAQLARAAGAQVLVRQRRGVDAEAVERELDGPDRVERAEQRVGRIAEVALEGAQRRDAPGDLLLRGGPGRLARIEVGEVPG